MRPKAQRVLTRLAALPLAALLLISLNWSGGGAHAQNSGKPISRKGLTESVKINGLSTTELVQLIRRRGVDFEMTADAEQDLLAAGARPEIIEAAQQNYRPRAATTTAANTKSAAPRPANSSPPARTSGPPVPPGSPLSKNEVITMLQGGIAPSRVEQFVEARGVNFAVTPDIAREITAAGGTRSLVGAITENSTPDVAETSSPFDSGDDAFDGGDDRNAGPNYDDLIDRAQSSISSSDLNSAFRYAQQAVQLDPSQPTAYSMLGTMLLYGRRDAASAEQAMRAAIERGGTAAFKAYHDHDGSFSNYCEGSFFVTKSGVSFKANDGRDTFETDDSNIKEVKTNGFVGAQYGAFHIKPKVKINNRDNFNFAPATQQRVESQLIIRLIQGY
ncbi:MAG: hypothetical protein M3407_07455 [Acidobacteriota bacterium]|nr:hypothetical protein [Acidobacteriota bacterium]